MMISSDIPTIATSKINILPGVTILSVLQHLNYKPWYAMAEFVDNSLQSYLSNRIELENIEGTEFRLKVAIELDQLGSGTLTIRDNAAGIAWADYARAFRPAELPPDRSGLSEFGMGMKSAACWFANKWSVRTSALGEPIERTISFDIATIVRDSLEELVVKSRPARENDHYTEIVLSELNRAPQGRTIGKIKDHLASIYRMYLRQNQFELTYDREQLKYDEPSILEAPYFKEPEQSSLLWKKPIDLDFGLGWRIHGFAGLREPASVSLAGFGLFRRNRLIQGSGEDSYRPEGIFGKANSYTYQRLFGELMLDGFEVSHTKDGFRWDDHEEIVIEELRNILDAPPLPLLRQAEGYRARPKKEDFRKGAHLAISSTADSVARNAPSVIAHQLQERLEKDASVTSFPPASTVTTRVIEVETNGEHWEIEIQLADDPGIGEWVSSYQIVKPGSLEAGTDGAVSRRLGIRLALSHPFMLRFAGTAQDQIEPLLRVAVAIILAEITAREGGGTYVGQLRRRINELLRDALSKP